MSMTDSEKIVAALNRAANVMEKAAGKMSSGESTGSSTAYAMDSELSSEERISRQRQILDLERQLGATQKERHAAEMEMLADEIREHEINLSKTALGTEEYKKQFKEIQRLKKQKDEYAKTQEKLNKQLEQGAGAAQQLQDRVLGIGTNLASLGKILPTSIRGLQGFFKEMGKSVITGDLFAGMFLKIASNSLDFAISLDTSTAAFKRATGAGNEYNSVIEAAGMKYLAYGVNAENAAKATTDLFNGFRDFTKLSEAEAESLIGTTALLEKFGVSGQTSSQILNQATKSLGMNVGEAEQLLLNIAPLAKSVGKPISEIASDLASAAPKLAFYGAGMINVFKELEAQSKATGLSVDELLGLVGEKFDTFEGAGMAVGKLNALLGGPYLNSIDMLNASEAERLEMIQQSLSSAGVVFDDLNKFEQKAFASAIGSDVDTLRKSLNDLDPAQELLNMQQEELASKAGEARDIMTGLKDAINSLVVSLAPAIETLSGWIKGISKFIVENKGLAKIIGTVGLVGAILFKVVFGTIAFRAARAQSLAVKELAASYGQLAAAQATAAATAPTGAQGPGARMAARARGLRQPLVPGLAPAAPVAPQGASFGRAAGGSMRAMKLGGGAAIGGQLLGAGFNYGAGKAQKAGKTGLATGLGVLGGAASGAGTGAMIGSMIPGIGTAIGAGVGGLIGGGMAYMNRPVEDGFFTRNSTGDVKVTPIDNKDNAIVAKKGGMLAKMGLMGGMGMMGPMGMLAAGGGMMIQKMIVKPIVDAITQSGNTNVVVKIGEKELNKQIIAALNSHQGKQAVSPFYQG